uniref:Neurotransmitter-gated ion-channel ligand-binding domain-containing protein n=1 Tax=Strongyloides stercoralis TaxID=6248 RepID=A0AAF5CYP8_STRER
TQFLMEKFLKKENWRRKERKKIDGMRLDFFWYFTFFVIGMPLLNDFFAYTYEVIGIKGRLFGLPGVGGELIRPNHGRKDISDEIKKRISRKAGNQDDNLDDKWERYQKVELPPWMEEDFLNTLDESDYLGPLNRDFSKERWKRNYFIDPTSVYMDDEKDGNDNGPKSFRSLDRQDIPVTYRLHRDLLRFYRKGTRPVNHPKKQISVSMSVFLYQIIKLDAVKNTISLSGSFELYWTDEFLRWNPSDYEGAEEIFLSSNDIWIPEFSLYYSLNFNDAVKLQSNNDVRVNYTGSVRFFIPFSTNSLCQLNVAFFPYDIQTCTLLFGSWAHSNDSIKYALYSKNLSLIDFYDNQEWELDKVNSQISADGFLYDYLDPPLFWDMVIIDLVVSRQSFYYVFNLVIPSTIITFVAVIGFHTPSTSGRVRDAKFRLGIMTLMSMSVILLAIVEDMPKFSMSSTRKGRGSFSGIPLIGLYYFILLAIIGLSTVTTSMFVFLERDVRRKHVIPWYLNWLSFDIPARNQMNHGVVYSNEINGTINSKQGKDSYYTNGEGTAIITSSSESNLSVGKNNRIKDCALSMVKLVSNKNDNLYQEPSTAYYNDNPMVTSTASDSTKDINGRYNVLKGKMIANPMNNVSNFQVDVFQQNLSNILTSMLTTLSTVSEICLNIRKEMSNMIPQDDYSGKWQVVIRRLELISLMFYITLLFSTMFLFFYHDWYCAVGHNPCGQQNLKCPWMHVNPNDPSCLP